MMEVNGRLCFGVTAAVSELYLARPLAMTARTS